MSARVRSASLVLAAAVAAWAAPSAAVPVHLPDRAQYVQAVKQGPLTAPELRNIVLDKSAKGQPISRSGNFATVFFATDPAARLGAKPVVLRVYHDPLDQPADVDLDHLGAFNETLAGELQKLRAADKLPAEILPFAYFRAGVTVDGKALPVLLEPRIEGKDFDAWIGGELAANHPEHVEAMARNFRAFVADMADAELAHGDLHHHNIRVQPDNQARLLDYDSMFTPELARAGHDQGEAGHPNFQHPAYHFQEPRQRRPYDAKMDRFSSIVIYVSLLAVAKDPQLWAAHHDDTRLIFDGETDFVAPDRSQLFKKLGAAADPMVRELAKQLAGYAKGAPGEVPSLEEAIQRAEGAVKAG